jgi:hypothetical protein
LWASVPPPVGALWPLWVSARRSGFVVESPSKIAKLLILAELVREPYPYEGIDRAPIIFNTTNVTPDNILGGSILAQQREKFQASPKEGHSRHATWP